MFRMSWKQYLYTSACSIILCSLSALASPPTAKEYVKIYNTKKGLFLRDHGGARDAVKAKYHEVALEEFDGDMSKFFTETMGSFVEYKKKRVSKWIGAKRFLDHFVLSSSGQCLEALEEFMAEKTSQVLEALNLKQEDHKDPLVQKMIRSANSDLKLKNLRAEMVGILKLAELAAQADPKTSGPLFISAVSSASLGVLVYFYGPAALMIGVEKVFPLIYPFVTGKVVPAAGSFSYYAFYLPAMKNAMGYAFQYSTQILWGLWWGGTTITYGSYYAAWMTSNLAHGLTVRAYHKVASLNSCERSNPQEGEFCHNTQKSSSNDEDVELARMLDGIEVKEVEGGWLSFELIPAASGLILWIALYSGIIS